MKTMPRDIVVLTDVRIISYMCKGCILIAYPEYTLGNAMSLWIEEFHSEINTFRSHESICLPSTVVLLFFFFIPFSSFFFCFDFFEF